MKVAALCDFPFWEERVGSAVRFASLCKSLVKVCDLSVVSTVSLSSSFKDFAASQPYELVDRSVLKYIHARLPPGDLPGVAEKNQVSVRAIRAFVESRDFDAVLTPYFNRKWMIEHLPGHIVRIIDTHDSQSQRTRSFARHGLIPTFLMTPEQEGRELDYYDIALAMSHEDFEEFTRISQIPVVTAPFRLPLRDVSAARNIYAPAHGDRSVLFVAADSEVNRLTLAFLLNDVLPLVPFPIVLEIVGNVQLPKGPPPGNVMLKLHENVADLVPIYARCALAVNPTYAGGGVKTKTLEALSFGVPVLTTDEGARGLRELVPDVLVVNEKETFAFRICELLTSPELRASLAQQQLAHLRAEDSEAWLPAFADILRALRGRKLEMHG